MSSNIYRKIENWQEALRNGDFLPKTLLTYVGNEILMVEGSFRSYEFSYWIHHNKSMDWNRSIENSKIYMENFPLVNNKKARNNRIGNKKSRSKRRLINIVAFFAVFGIIFIIVGLVSYSKRSSKNDEHYPVVETECGPVQGVIEYFEKSSGYVFKGIPFAEPPVGNQRWKPPQRHSSWKGILKADTFRPPCFQFHGRMELGSEDCLYINIWSPGIRATHSLPVMVLIASDDLIIGSPGIPGITPNVEFTVKMNVVAVTVSYRLNAFGFLALELLSKYSDSQTSGNYGLMDQILALNWIQRNIQSFGGDPSKVTIVGHGAGATAIYGLLASNKTIGLFYRAIAMSGSVILSKTAKAAFKDNEVFLNNSKCNEKGDNQILECLYKLNASQVLHALPWSSSWRKTDLNDLPSKGHFDGALYVIDGDIVTAPPGELGRELPMSHKVVVMIGTTAQEISFLPVHNFTGEPLHEFAHFADKALSPFSAQLPKQAIGIYKTKLNSTDPQLLYTTMASDIRYTCPSNMLSMNLSNGNNLTVYRYIVTNRPNYPAKFALKPTKYSAHTWDLSALFGFSGMPLGYNPTQRDLKFRDAIRKVFLDFMQAGKPGMDEWKAYPLRVGIFEDERVSIESAYHTTMCQLWSNYSMFKYGCQ